MEAMRQEPNVRICLDRKYEIWILIKLVSVSLIELVKQYIMIVNVNCQFSVSENAKDQKKHFKGNKTFEIYKLVGRVYRKQIFL